MKKNIRFHYAFVSIALLMTGLLILLAVNVLAAQMEKKNGWRLDCSFNGITTQSKATVDLLNQLDTPVHIYALFPKGEEDAQLMELLDRYASRSNMITWEQADPALNPTLITSFQTGGETINSDSLIVWCEQTNKWKVLDPSDFVTVEYDYIQDQFSVSSLIYEERITTAISNVIRDTVPVVTVLQGHGELDADTLKYLNELLNVNHYDMKYVDLMDNNEALEPENLLCILSPLRDLMDTELDKVMNFAEKGGSLLLTCDYSDPIDEMPNYQALLRAYGAVTKEGIVVASKDEPDSFYSNVRIDLIPEMVSTDLTMDLIVSGADTLLMAGTRAFEVPEDNDRNLMVSELLRSSEKSYLKVLSSASTTMDQETGDVCGPFTLAMESRRTTSEGYISRAVILGCSSLLTDAQIHSMTDSQAFTVRMIEFLTNSDSVDLDIMPKLALRPSLSAESTGMGSVMIVALPMLVLLMAMIILVPRRNK